MDIFSLGIKFENDKEIFYKNRSKFNSLTKEEKINTPEAAALFYYLNKTVYNVLMRSNSKGFVNTPFGKYKKINYLFNVEYHKKYLKIRSSPTKISLMFSSPKAPSFTQIHRTMWNSLITTQVDLAGKIRSN